MATITGTEFEAVISITATVQLNQSPLQTVISMTSDTVVVTHSLVLTMPVPILQMSGRSDTCNLSLTMPVPALSMTGLTGDVGNLRLTMPPPTLYMSQGGNLALTIPLPILQMTGLNGTVGQISLQGILPSLEMNAHINEVGNLILFLNPPTLSISGKINEYGSLSLSLSPPKISIHGFSGFLGSLSLQLRMPSLLMNGFIEARGSLSLAMPMPSLSMTGDQFFAARYLRGLVMNMSHFSVTDYIGYDFNSMAYFNGKFFGGNNQGIFSFGGNKDNGQNINARLKMPILDSYMNVIRKARDAWLTLRTDGQMMLVVQFGEEDYYDDIFEETGKAYERRGKLPKGIDERFLAFEIRNVDGSDFDINNLRLTTDTVPGRKK